MNFQLTQPTLVIGIGGVGSKIASEAKNLIQSNCLLISHNQKDLPAEFSSIKVSTQGIVNPSTQLLRGFTTKNSEQIQSKISEYSTVIVVANLAGKTGAAMAPIVSQICKDQGKNVLSFAIMPFKYEKDRIFHAGLALKRLNANSNCTIVFDNDSILDSNPDLSTTKCYEIADSAILHIFGSLQNSLIPENTNVITTGRNDSDLEQSLKDSLKMLYENAPPNSVKRSMLYVLGGNEVPVGLLNSITNLTSGFFSQENTQVDLSTSSSEETKVVMLSQVQGETRFDKYDPLGVISQEKTLDWEIPECSIDCKLDLNQIE